MSEPETPASEEPPPHAREDEAEDEAQNDEAMNPEDTSPDEDEGPAGALERARAALPPRRIMRVGSWLVPLVLYVSLLSWDVTIGDGPELLVAMMNLGGAHPSGYPLLTMLGYPVAHFPLGTPNFNASLMLSALPGALAAWIIYETLRERGVRGWAALVVCWGYALNERVLYQCTRVEVYALHSMFIAGALYYLARYRRPDPEPRWLYLATLMVCLGLTNHLTMSFMIPVVIVWALTVAPRQLFSVRRLGTLGAIALGCASLYLYAPLQAMANAGGRTIAWGDPSSWDRFVYYVTGAEYRVFRGPPDLPEGIKAITRALEQDLFGGVLIILALGWLELTRRHWRLGVLGLGFGLSVTAYIGGYKINDISTYYPTVYVVVFLWLGLGVEWLLHARLEGLKGWTLRAVSAALFVAGACGAGWLYWSNRAVAYREAYGQDMGEQTIELMPPGSIIFTDVDRHTFTMWYQGYVEHPDKEIVVISTGLYTSIDRVWYRDFLWSRHPDVEWPTLQEALGNQRWKRQIIEANPGRRYFTFPWKRWKVPGTHLTNRGWVHEIHLDGPEHPDPNHGEIKYVYMTRHKRIQGEHIFHDSEDRYQIGDRIACMVTWQHNHPDITGSWTFTGPGGARVEYPSHRIPPGSDMSWEYLPEKDQVPGEWTCEVDFPEMAPLRRRFEMVAP